MKLAVLNCLKANGCCAGAACLRALTQRQHSFARYAGQDIRLVAFARCNGCEAGIDQGFREKLDRIVSEGAEVVHLGICTRNGDRECPTITEAAGYLQERGLTLVRGTH